MTTVKRVVYSAACPACGSDASWTAEVTDRVDARVRYRIACVPCDARDHEGGESTPEAKEGQPWQT